MDFISYKKYYIRIIALLSLFLICFLPINTYSSNIGVYTLLLSTDKYPSSYQLLFEEAQAIFNNSERYIVENNKTYKIYSENKSYDVAKKEEEDKDHRVDNHFGFGLKEPEIIEDGFRGGKALKLRVDKPAFPDPPEENRSPWSQRIEIQPRYPLDFGVVRYVGFCFKAPKGVSKPNEEDMALITQCWQRHRTNEDVSGPSLYMVYRIKNNGDKALQFRVNNSTNGEIKEIVTYDQEVDYDRWYIIVIGYKFGNDGWVKMWIDGEKKVDISDKVGFDYSNQVSEKFGLYRGDVWKHKNTGSLEIHLDEIRKGNSYSEVNPNRDSVPSLCNSSLNLEDLATSYDPDDIRAAAGVFTIEATFSNISNVNLKDLYFETVVLSGSNKVLNADNAPGNVGSIVSVPPEALSSDQILSPGESFNQDFEIGLQSQQPFKFFVNAFCVPSP